MPFVHTTDTTTHDMHGARFTAVATTALGSTDMCVYRVELPAGTPGLPHTVSHEAVVVVLDGQVQFQLGDDTTTLAQGEAAVVPPGQLMSVNTTAQPATIMTSTKLGFQATMTDGSRLTPPWSR